MAKTKFFRVGVEGATVDGRNIQREWLEQMAANYDPVTYTARINCEHIAGYSPDKPFNAYGSVLSLKTEEVTLLIAGESKTLLALYAEIDANDQLVAINKAGQKLFTSMEIHPDFAGAGEAYLVGLAVTDSPASLGTEALKFAAQSRSNIFSSACETTIELEPSTDSSVIAEGVKTGLMSALGSWFAKEKPKEEPAAAPPPAPANDNSFDMAKFASVLGQQIADAVKPANDAVAALGARFDQLETQLKTEEKPKGFNRSPATGGKGAIITDC